MESLAASYDAGDDDEEITHETLEQYFRTLHSNPRRVVGWTQV
jgi:hypothetical protein